MYSETNKENQDIKGLDLKIDLSVQKLCETFNASASSTRSVLYVLLIVSILSMITVINTHKGNWYTERIDRQKKAIRELNYAQSKMNKDYLIDSTLLYNSFVLKEKISAAESERDYLLRNKIENFQTVRVPILGNSFDANNLCIICGIAFIILLYVLQFTLTREKNGIKIALKAITERYAWFGLSDVEFDGIVLSMFSNNKRADMERINKTRRKYHYNFLSMSQVFLLPPLDVNKMNAKPTLFELITRDALFYFPYFSYLIIFINDLTTIDEGLKVSPLHTIISSILSLIALTIIAYISYRCNFQKKIINDLFSQFYKNDYSYHPESFEPLKVRWYSYLFFSIIPVKKGITKLFKSF